MLSPRLQLTNRGNPDKASVTLVNLSLSLYYYLFPYSKHPTHLTHPTRLSEMATPSLLGIPRDLRDIIYGYCHQDIEIEWPWSNRPTSIYNTELRVKNSPLTTILFVHSQLQAKYVEADCFRKPRIILDLSDGDSDFYSGNNSNSDDDRDKNEKLETQYDDPLHVRDLNSKARVSYFIFTHARELRVFMKTDWYYANQCVFWSSFERPIINMASSASHLTVIHIALQVVHSDSRTAYDRVPVIKTENVFTHKERPPNAVTRLHLTRYGYGHQIGPGQMIFSFLNESHNVAELGTYTFTNKGQSVPMWFPSKEEGRMLQAYTPDALSVYPEESREMMARWPFEIQDWTEICEADIGLRAGDETPGSV